MTDPFSVAGSAVGVVSLGLTVCKELISYVGHVKDRDVEVELISGRMEKLAGYLEQLQSIVNKVDDQTTRFGSNVTAIATGGIEACAAALRKIEAKLPSTTDVHTDTTFRGRARAWKTHLAYPFRRDDIVFLKDMVESVQQNLTTALQALQLDLQRLSMESSSEQLNRLSDLTVSSNRMIHDISTTSSQVVAVKNTLDPFASEVRTMLTTLVAQVNRLDKRTSDTSSESYGLPIVQEDIYQFRQIQNRVGRLNTSRAGHRSLRFPMCDCKPATDTKTIMWPFNITLSRTQQHKSGCSYSKFQQIDTRLQIRMAICGFRLQRKAEISFDICSGGGVFSFMPAWRIQRVVSWDSPAFALLRQLREDEGITKDYDQRMLQLFERREATPYDVDEDGRTLLHRLLGGMFSRGTPNISSNYLQMTKFLLETMGPVAQQSDSFGRSCVDDAVLVNKSIPHEISEAYLEIMRSDIQPNWSTLGYSSTKFWSSMIPFIKNSEILQDFAENHPIIFSMLSKSESALEALIRKNPNIVNQLIGTMTLLELATAVAWPVGCEVLLQAGAMIARTGQNLLDIAVYSMCKDIVQFWLDQRRLVSQDDLEHIGSPERVLVQRYEMMGKDLHQSFIDHIVAVRQELWKKTRSALPDLISETSNRILDAEAGGLYDILVRAGVDVHQSLRPSWPSIYQPLMYKPEKSAVELYEKLYNTGFLDLELKDVGPGLMSPMQWNALSGHFYLCKWLLSKGLSLDERWYASHVTARQILGFVVGNNMQWWNFKTHETELFLLKLFQSNCSDECSCACTTATSGCTFMSSYFKAMGSLWSRKQHLFIFTSWAAPAVRTDRGLASVVIRSLTFWKLRLQHTCCDIWELTQETWKVAHDNCQGYEELVKLSPTPYSPDELAQVQDEDSFLIERLEVLVARCVEQFEYSDEDIVDFILGYWSEQMRYELEELSRMDDEEYGEDRMRLGVKLDREEAIDGLTGDIDLDTGSYKGLPLRESIPTIWNLDEFGEESSKDKGFASNDGSASSEKSNALED